jgi:thermitase
LQAVFRQLLRATCDPPPADHGGQFGAGIVNVQRLLQAALPLQEQVDISFLSEMLESELELAPQLPAEDLTAVFDTVPAHVVQENLAVMAGTPELEAAPQLGRYEEELLFHILTNPELRAPFTGEMTAGEGELESGAPAIDLYAALQAVPGLSTGLRAQLA